MKTPFWLIMTAVFNAMTASSDPQPPTAGATFIDSNKVAVAFARGMPVLENGEFKVRASRRDNQQPREPR